MRVELAKRLFQAAHPPKESHGIAGAGHNDLQNHGLAAKVIAFVGRMVNVK